MKKSVVALCIAVTAWCGEISPKDELIGSVARTLVGEYLQKEGIGELKTFRLDSKTKKIELECALKGELTPVQVAIGSYAFSKVEIVEPCSAKATGNYKSYFLARNITTNREWLNNAARGSLKEFRIEIPKLYYGILEFLLQ